MEGGRTATKSCWDHGGRGRLHRKIGRSGQVRGPFSSNQFHERKTTGEERGGDKPSENDDEKRLSCVGANGARREECTEEVVEEQRRRREEQLRRFAAAEGEERKRKGGGCGKPVEGVIFNDEDEDGVHGGRMKPLASFDVNRDMPPPQNRKLRIKLSSPDDNQAPALDGAAPKAIRRAQDKENGGLVPLCPGTTQIRGMKRKTVSPTDSKAHGGGKRNRLPFGSGGNATELQLRKGPAASSTASPVAEIERDESRGMDMLLMALKAADPNCLRSISPMVPLAINGDKAVKNLRPTMRVVAATTAHLDRPQDKEDARKEGYEDSSCSDEDGDEELQRILALPVMRPHRWKTKSGLIVPCTYEKAKGKSKEEERSSGSGEDPDCTEDSATKYVLRAESYCRTSEEALASRRYDSRAVKKMAMNANRHPRNWKQGNSKEKPEASKEDEEDSDGTGEELDLSDDDLEEGITKINGYRAPSKKPLERTRGKYDTSRDEEEMYAICSDVELDRYAAKPHRFRPPLTAKSLDGANPQCKAKNNKEVERGCSGALVDKYVRGPHQYRSAAPTVIEDEVIKYDQEEMQQDFEARELEEAAPSCSDDDDDVADYVRNPHRYRAAQSKEAFGKNTNLLNGREENRGDKSPRDVDKNEAVIKPHLSKLRPSQARVLLCQLKSQVRTQTRKDEIGATTCSYDEEDKDKPIIKPLLSNLLPSQAKLFMTQEQKFNQRALECRITGPSYSAAVSSHRQRKVIERREPTGHDSVVGISPLGEQGPKIAEKSPDRREGNDFQCLPKDSTWAKCPPGSRQQQSRRKEASGAARSASCQQPWNYTKKRKASDHISACCIVPKQVNLATGSRLLETGEPSHPSVGSVVVECLPPSTELQKEDNNRAPFGELQNREALWSLNSLQLPHLKAAKDVGSVWNTDKENRSWTVSDSTPSDCPSSAGVKAPPGKHVYDGGAGPPRVVRVAGNTKTLGGTIFGNSVRPLKDSRIHLGSDSQFVGGTTSPEQQQQQRSNATLGAGSITRTGEDNEDNDTCHEIAGITMQRRSWEALKAAEYFAKKRFDPKAAEAPYDFNHSVPTVPSRFRDPEYRHVVQGVSSNSKPKINFGTTHSTHGAATALSGGSAGVTSTHAVVSEKKVTYRRGPYKQGGNKHERLSTKVLNRNLENSVQLKDVICPDGAIDFSRLHTVQTGAHDFPANGCYDNRQHLSRSYSCSGLPKAPMALKIRQRRGQKRLEKEKFKTINVKTSSSVCNFKPLLEPSGLLGEFNPGIIQRVRNSVQIHAILGALIGAASCNSSLPKVPAPDSACVPPVMTKEAEGELEEKRVGVKEILHKEECLTNGETASVVVQEKFHKEEYSTQAETISVVAQETFHKEENTSQAETSVEIQDTLQTQEYLMAIGGSIEKEQVPQVQGSDLREDTLDHQGELLLLNEEQREPLAVPSQLHQGLPETAGLASLTDEAVNADCLHEQLESLLTQGLPSVSSEDPGYAEEDNDEQELQPMSGKDSSSTAAGLAGRWLELLTLDIKGRLSALKRSRRRVQSTLQSGQLSLESGGPASVMAFNPPSTTRPAIDIMDILGSQQSVCSDATTAPQTSRQDESSSQQVDRWRALFTNMDGVLGNEANKLESWLWQIKQMQAFCPISSQQPFSGPEAKSHVAAFSQGLATSNLEFGKQQPPQRWPLTIEAIETELGFAASAASIMSTANFVTKVHSFR